MTGLSRVHCVGVVLVVAVAVTTCGAQIFPFSNLKHIFEQKGRTKVGLLPTAEPPAPTTTPDPPTTTAVTNSLAPYLGPVSLFDADGGYRHLARPAVTKPAKADKAAKPTKPTKASRPIGQQEQTPAKQQHAAESMLAPYYRLAPNNPQQVAYRNKSTHPKQPSPPWQESAKQKTPTQGQQGAAHAWPRPTARPHLVPLRIAYEPTTPSEDEIVAPPLYLTPPRLPAANLVPAENVASSSAPPRTNQDGDEGIDAAASSHAAAPAAAPIPMPPVPAVYLRPPGPPGPSGPPEPILFKPLQLADDGEVAALETTSPGVNGRPATNTTPANHKLTPAAHNALPVGAPPSLPPPGRGLGASKLGAEYTNHHSLWPDKPGASHSPKVVADADADGDAYADSDPLNLVESSAAASAAAAVVSLGPGRTPANHRAQLRPQPPPSSGPLQHQHQLQHHLQLQRAPKHKNHKAAPPGPPPARPIRYLNHKPANLDGEESMTSLRYRKRPLGPLEQAASATGLQHAGLHPGYTGLGDGDRVEFQMHGLQGPESYKFGYDTGNGHNRQFRYEERDHVGNVKGHYGYVDGHGKLQVVNYKADPHGGYNADVSKLHT